MYINIQMYIHIAKSSSTIIIHMLVYIKVYVCTHVYIFMYGSDFRFSLHTKGGTALSQR